MSLCDKISSFPTRAGVYLFKDAHGQVIYVGKAENLRSRVANYFGAGKDTRPQVEFLVKRAKDIEYIVTDTEKEALLLENTLIKQHRPRYNIHFRDDKTYISIRIGLEHESPGISATRHPIKDGARYFGPYPSGLACRDIIEQIIRHFRIRSCTDREFANRVRPCVLYDIGRCTAPCVGKVARDAYSEQVNEAVMFLDGKSSELTNIMEQKMNAASEAEHFEDAARYRDLIAEIDHLVEKQKVVHHGAGDRDVAAIAVDAQGAAACILTIRGGTLIGTRTSHLGNTLAEEQDAFEMFILQKYSSTEDLPPEIILMRDIEGHKALEDILSERKGARVTLRVPQKGELKDLVRLAYDNARETLKQKGSVVNERWQTLERLRGKLRLPRTPDIIECLDISNLQGEDAYGSLVSFVMGEADKTRYRLYKIRTIETPDDYTMMREVIERRFRPISVEELDKKTSYRPPPDLFLIDGGKGQLGIAQKVFSELGVVGVSLASIAKGESKGRETDDIYLPGRKNPLKFRKGSKELLLLMQIRDEAHRFGIKAYRARRLKTLTS